MHTTTQCSSGVAIVVVLLLFENALAAEPQRPKVDPAVERWVEGFGQALQAIDQLGEFAGILNGHFDGPLFDAHFPFLDAVQLCAIDRLADASVAAALNDVVSRSQDKAAIRSAKEALDAAIAVIEQQEAEKAVGAVVRIRSINVLIPCEIEETIEGRVTLKRGDLAGLVNGFVDHDLAEAVKVPDKPEKPAETAVADIDDPAFNEVPPDSMIDKIMRFTHDPDPAVRSAVWITYEVVRMGGGDSGPPTVREVLGMETARLDFRFADGEWSRILP